MTELESGIYIIKHDGACGLISCFSCILFDQLKNKSICCPSSNPKENVCRARKALFNKYSEEAIVVALTEELL